MGCIVPASLKWCKAEVVLLDELAAPHGPATSKPKTCERCGGAEQMLRHRYTRFCRSCAPKRMQDAGGSAAHRAVQRAINRGELPRANTLVCVDCGKPAHDYDQRDYAKPLEVEPVCRSCNKLRGPARPVLTFELPDAVGA